MRDHQPTADRWRRRPGLARLYRAYAFVGPLVTLLAVAFFCIRLLPDAGSALEAVVRWLLVASSSLGAALLTERALHGLLVVAALLELDLGFPGAVPTRTRIASLASLRGDGRDRRLRSPEVARDMGGRGEVVPDELDAAAEHAVTRYGAMMGDGLQPRTHLSRVRAVAALMADELRVPTGDRDRLEWALLLREIGTPTDDPAHVHRPVVDWLGPWSALVQGPFIATATRTSPRVAWAAHVAAVADAYVVLTAAHPYERSLLGGNRLPFEALAAQRLSARAVEALLAVPVPARRRAAGFTSGVVSGIVHHSPRPRPAFALASLLIVAALGAGGVGTPQTTDLPSEAVAAGSDPARRGTVAQRATEIPDAASAPATRRVAVAEEGGRRTPAADEPQPPRASGRSARPWTTATAGRYPDTPGGGAVGPAGASEAPAATATPSAGASVTPSSPRPQPTPQPTTTAAPTAQPEPKPDPQPTSEPAAGDETAGDAESGAGGGGEPPPATASEPTP